jgi:hypothetical protein
MFRFLRAVRFLFLGPVILLFLVLVNYMTYSGTWWVKWAALGIGIAWVISLFRVVGTLAVAGGLAALFAYFRRRSGP